MRYFLLLLLVTSTSLTLRAESSIYTVIGEDGLPNHKLTQEFIREVEPYIRQYPPRFKSKNHQDEVIINTKNILKELNGIELEAIANIKVIVDIAYILAMSHNLNLGTAPSAKSTFEYSLSLAPSNKKANYLFGMFLISTKQYHFESEKYLQKAYDLGEKDALFSLALLELEKGNKNKSLNMLKKYSDDNPSNKHALKIINAIENNQLKFNSSNGS